ncbi:hypothetical protein JCM14469_23740 [Desulfatiferula olefinivorans]
MKIYIASPLFSPMERAFNLQLCEVLEPYFQVYLPQRDGILIEDEITSLNCAKESAIRQAFQEDIAAIQTSDFMLAVLDGRVPDEGVCVELGYAKAIGIHIIGFKSDARIALPWGHNPIIEGCIDFWVSDLTKLKLWAERVL